MTQAQVAQAGKPTEPKPPSRMTLSAVVRGKIEKPLRILLYGVEKIGKSTFAAGAPEAIFICPEDGTAQLDVARFPEPRTWDDVLGAVETLTTQPHDYRTAVFDTMDWLEPMLWAYVCERDGKTDLESYGYGRGFQVALDEWRRFLAKLEHLRSTRGMTVILLAHSWIKKYQNPEGEDFDRYELKLHLKASGLLKEWCDAVLFANHETFAATDKNKRTRGVSTGARYVYTQRSAAYDAGNRYNLPPQLPLDWTAFAEAVAANRPADLSTIKERITELLVDVNAELKAKVEAAIAKAPTDAAYLARVLNKLAATVGTKEQSA